MKPKSANQYKFKASMIQTMIKWPCLFNSNHNPILERNALYVSVPRLILIR